MKKYEDIEDDIVDIVFVTIVIFGMLYGCLSIMRIVGV